MTPADDVTMHFAALPLLCLEVVSKFGSPIKNTIHIGIGRTPSPKLFLTTVIVGDFIQVAHFVKDLEVLMANSFSSSIHCRETASKTRGLLKSGRPLNYPCIRLHPLHYNK